MVEKDDKFRRLMSSKLYDVEHALGVYAYSFYFLPAEAIYNDDLDVKLGAGTEDCHIYLIGILPKVDLQGASQDGTTLHLELEILGSPYSVSGPIGEGLTLKHEEDLWYLEDNLGNRFGPSDEQVLQAIQAQHDLLEFHVVYVGQAYGRDGSRNALERLKKHETLQKIALQGTPEGYRLQIMLIEIHPSNQVFTSFNPLASDISKGKERIRKGFDKLFGTDKHERVTLYEASLISYFQPKFNKIFKNSFPSTDLKVLADCYDKDFTAIVAELCFDNLPFPICSDEISRKYQHVIKIDLHSEENRRVFFGAS